MNSNAKGGVEAETDAVANIKKFEAEYSRPDKVTWLNPGGLAKMRQKQPIVFPTGLDKLMEFAITSIRDTSGVNLELLGLADRDQPGVLEAQRKKAGITILAHMFDSLRLMRREIGRQLLYYIQENMSDGRLARVVGDGMKQYIPLTRDITAGEYDVEVDESPTSPNQKDQVFAALTQILPGIMKAGVPVPPDILDYMPLPSTLIDKWKQYIQQQQAAHQQQTPQPDPAAMAKIQADQQASQAKMQFDIQSKQMDIQAQQQKAMSDMELEKLKIAAESANKMAIAKLEAETKIIVAEIGAKNALQTAAISSSTSETGGLSVDENGKPVKQPGMADLISVVTQQLQATLAGIHQSNTTLAQNLQATLGGIQNSHNGVIQSHNRLADAISKPKNIIRDKNHRMTSIQ